MARILLALCALVAACASQPKAAVTGESRTAAIEGRRELVHLDSPADREAFRQWFTFLAEAQAAHQAGQLPAEIGDCAGLLRFAYREALRKHDGEWAESLRLSTVPPGLPDVEDRPAGPDLFLVSPGQHAQFADAETLMRKNAFFRSRNLERAAPGDLLFYRQLGRSLPYHAMVVVGRSRIEPSAERWLVYHTGPNDGDPGEIRRVTYEQLLQHPMPQWRPVDGNSNFLGVYCWNILRENE